MGEQSSWFFVWIPRKDYEKQLVKKEREEKELAKKKEEEQLKLEEEQKKQEEELIKKLNVVEEKQGVIENGAVNKAFEDESECEQITGLVPIVEEQFDPLKPSNIPLGDSVNIIEVKEASEESKPKDLENDPAGSLELEEATPVESFQNGIPNELLDINDETDKPSSQPSPRVDFEDVVDDKEKDDTEEYLKDFISLEEILERELTTLNVDSLSWQVSRDKNKVLAMFVSKSSEAEHILSVLHGVGIGQEYDSTISVVKTTLHYESVKKPATKDEATPREESVDLEAGTESVSMEDIGRFENKVDQFYSSIKSRMMVSEVIVSIENNAQFTFDFLMLLMLAGVIAFLGMLESSSVTLVASMLISPLMGPILAGVFGTVITDRKLTMLGVINELIALGICILVGFFLGLLVVPLIPYYGVPEWPTPEMMSRGQLRSLWVGVLVAIPSGAGVALSVLGGNAGSLVGVAISASLLPPAVNAGLLWAVSLIVAVSESSFSYFGHGMAKGNRSVAFNETHFETVVSYVPQYSHNPVMESYLLGCVSLGLTLLNIICIIVTGIAILRLKEVTPDKIPQNFSSFWKEDVKSRRGKYSRLDTEEELMQEGKEQGLDGTFMQEMFEQAHTDQDLDNIRRWVAATQGSRIGGRTKYNYTVISERPGVSQGPGYRVNKAHLLRMSKLQQADPKSN